MLWLIKDRITSASFADCSGEPSIRGHNPFALGLQRKGAVLMVSWSDIFQFVMSYVLFLAFSVYTVKLIWPSAERLL